MNRTGDNGRRDRPMTKKILALIMILCLCLTVTAACTEEAQETLLERVLRLSEDGADLIEEDDEDLLDILGIEPEWYTDFAWLIRLDNTDGREIILIRATDDEAADHIVEELTYYRDGQLEAWANYFPERYKNMSEAEILREDLLIVLSVGAPDPNEPELLLREE